MQCFGRQQDKPLLLKLIFFTFLLAMISHTTLMAQTNMKVEAYNEKSEAYLSDFAEKSDFQVIRGEKPLNDVKQLGFQFEDKDRIIVKSGCLQVIYFYSGKDQWLCAEPGPGGAVSYLVEKDKEPSPLSKLRKAIFDFFQALNQIQEATHPDLKTKGGKVSRQDVFPPENCRVERDDTLVFAWDVQLDAPTLELTWKPAGRSTKEPDADEGEYVYRWNISSLLKRRGKVPDEQEVIFNWHFTDLDTNFDVSGEMTVLKADNTVQLFSIEGLNKDNLLQLQLGQLIQEKLYIRARKVLSDYLHDSPDKLQNSMFLKKATEFLKVRIQSN